MSELLGFLIFYKKSTGAVLVQQYPNSTEAIMERLKLVMLNHDDDLEIASINAASFDSLTRSHSRYFMRVENLDGVLVPDVSYLVRA